MSATDPDQIPLFSAAEGLPRFLAGYRPLSNIHDELVTAERGLRPHWTPLIEAFQRMGEAEIERRFGFADRHLRDHGVVHRIYDARGGAERPLPLSHVPLVIDREDWAVIERAVIQRAELINRVLADVYGPCELIRGGHLPAALIAGNPEFLRPMVGVAPAGGAHLLFYAVDIGRGPDGRWWVLRDRTQAPHGAGYAVENRIALSRAMPELYQPLHVKRLAQFFRAWRDDLNAKSKSGYRVGVLSAGPYNESAFEHAYLARYLGFLLLEGEDLVVRDDSVYVSTISGLQPIDVLLRRLDADFADPLMFNANSWIGTPGLGLAAQAGSVVIANALGSGVAEAAGLMSFLPSLARKLLNEDLRLPNVATWWCGQPDAQAAVAANFDKLVIAPAFGPILPGLLDEGAVHVGDLQQPRRDQIAAAINARGVDFVAQEAVRLSTMPVWNAGRLEPRPFMLRVFAARTASGWQVLPGGFCQVSASVDPRAVSLQRGSSVADVWVLSDRVEPHPSLLTAESSAELRHGREALPTRTAENLFWMGRYLERAEGCARLVRALALRLVAFGTGEDAMIPFIAQLLFASRALQYPDVSGPQERANAAIATALMDPNLAGGVRLLLSRARACAAKARDQISADTWRILTELVDLADRGPADSASAQESLVHCDEVLDRLSALAGLADNNMNRRAGWHFLQLGARLERAMTIAYLARTLGETTAPPGAFEALLELTDSQIHYGTLYSNVPTRPQVMDIVLLDVSNPRSLAYQAKRIEDHVGHLPEKSAEAGASASRSEAAAVTAEFEAVSPGDITSDRLRQVTARLAHLSDAITADYFLHLKADAGGSRG